MGSGVDLLTIWSCNWVGEASTGEEVRVELAPSSSVVDEAEVESLRFFSTVNTGTGSDGSVATSSGEMTISSGPGEGDWTSA